MKKYVCEITKTGRNCYTTNLYVEGEYVPIEWYVNYSKLRYEIYEKTGIIIPLLRDLYFSKFNYDNRTYVNYKYAYIGTDLLHACKEYREKELMRNMLIW